MKIDKLPDKIAFVDLETTGGSPFTGGRIIEIGILRVENNKVVAKMDQLINPEIYIPDFVQKMTGIYEEDVFLAPTFSQVKNDVLEILKDCVFVAHNVSFDYGFLKTEFLREEINFKMPYFCSAKLSRYLFTEYKKHNLDSIIERYNLSCESRHRAFGDAEVIWKFYQNLQKNVPSDKLIEAIRIVSKKPSTFLNIPANLIEELPECEGVYMFFDDKGELLYVGDGKNIKLKVKNHFIKSELNNLDIHIFKEAYDIGFIETAGKLGRKLRKIQIIKEKKPKLNKSLNNQSLFVLKKTEEKEGLFRFEKKVIDKISIKDKNEILAISYKEKEIDKVIDKARFILRQLKTDKIRHNLKFIEIFEKTRIKRWPFEKKIEIIEENKLLKLWEKFEIENWKIKKVSNNIQDKLNFKTNFDMETYKVIKKVLRDLDKTVIRKIK